MKTFLIILAVVFVCNLIHGILDHEFMKNFKDNDPDE
jgi:preprotein translocase subunit SecE